MAAKLLGVALCLMGVLGVVASSAAGQTYYNSATDTDWFTPSNWHNGVPSGATYPIIGHPSYAADAVVDLAADAGTVSYMMLGRSGGAGTLNMTGAAKLAIPNYVEVGENAKTGGGVSGAINMGGTLLDIGSFLRVGFTGHGVVDQTAGSVHVGDVLYMGPSNNAVGEYTLGAGASLSVDGYGLFGQGSGQAIFTQNGGDFSLAGVLYLDRSNDPVQSSYTIYDGTASFAQGVYMHENLANGLFSIAGGEVSVGGVWYTTLAATTSLTGGALRVSDYRSNHGGANDGTMVNSGTVLNPGAAVGPGVFNLYGNYQQDDGALQIEIAGAAAYDVMALQGGMNAVLNGGDLLVDLLAFEPTATDVFTVLTASSVIGTFANAPVSGGTYNLGGGFFTVTYNAGSVVLSDYQPIPEPATMTLLALGLVMGLGRRASRN